jgi:preprotein translocase subunit SecY
MFLMWLGEQITERGIGNGISMIILAGIVAGMPAAIAGTAELVRNGEMSPATAILMLVGGVAAIVFVVFMERAQRRITVNYARRQQGRKMYAAQSTHLPFKINMSGFSASLPSRMPYSGRCRPSVPISARASRCTCCCTAP